MINVEATILLNFLTQISEGVSVSILMSGRNFHKPFLPIFSYDALCTYIRAAMKTYGQKSE
jgi:hypothetical protein